MVSKIIPINSLKLIGIHGHAHTGKDTISGYLGSNYKNVYGESFAGPLKDACSEAFGIDREDFNDPDVKELTNDYWGVSPRMIAQFVGTEFFRERIGELLLKADQYESLPTYQGEFWIRRLAGRLTGALNECKNNPYTPGDCVVISDVRFQNEYDWIIANDGIIIHLTRTGKDGAVGIANHASESTINMHATEATFHVENNSSFTYLYEQIDAIVGNHLERKEDIFPL